MTDLILIVDDEPNIVQLVRLYLEREGYRVEAAVDGLSALRLAQSLQPALMVLDIMLPGLDGLEVCRRLRQSGSRLPVILLTARDEDIDKIVGLELGADDYLTKPFNPRELTARVKAVLRRAGDRPSAQPGSTIVSLAGLVIDPQRREARLDSRPLKLRPQEFDLLWVLACHAGLALSREKLLELAWGFDFFGQTRTVDVHVASLRRKLAGSALHIDTITSVGYKLVG